MKEMHDGHAYSRKSRSSAAIPLVLVTNCATTPDRLAATFWALIDRSGGDDACWPWTRSITTSGYGQIVWGGTRQVVHRIAYQLTKGEIPEGFAVDHLCFNKRCCNPRHLEAVTVYENNWRSYAHYGINGARTHCPSGHEYDAANTRLYRGRRYCKPCQNGARLTRVGNGAALNDGPADRSNALPVELNAGGG